MSHSEWPPFSWGLVLGRKAPWESLLMVVMALAPYTGFSGQTPKTVTIRNFRLSHTDTVNPFWLFGRLMSFRDGLVTHLLLLRSSAGSCVGPVSHCDSDIYLCDLLPARSGAPWERWPRPSCTFILEAFAVSAHNRVGAKQMLSKYNLIRHHFSSSPCAGDKGWRHSFSLFFACALSSQFTELT